MSLYVYLRLPGAKVPKGSGIFIRDNGQTVELTREEWDLRFPGREPVVVRYDEGESDTVFEANVTHNLTHMAREAGIYLALWRPAELDADRAARIRQQEQAKNYHGSGGAYEIENEAAIYARDLIQPLRDGLALLQSEPRRFEVLDPKNGWGSYASFVPWVARYLAACERWPDAEVRVSR